MAQKLNKTQTEQSNKTIFKMEVLMKKTMILAVAMLVAQNVMAAPGQAPKAVRDAKAGQKVTESNVKDAMSALKLGELQNLDVAAKLASNKLGVNNAELGKNMNAGLAKLVGEAIAIKDMGAKASESQVAYAEGIYVILSSVGKTHAQDVIRDAKVESKKAMTLEVADRLIAEVLPRLIAEGGSAESIQLITLIGTKMKTKSKAVSVYEAIKETYGLKDAKDVMAKIEELKNCRI